MTHDQVRKSPQILGWVAAARVAVGAAMLASPSAFFAHETGTEKLLMQTIGIRDLVLGSGGCVAWLRRRDGEFRGWAAAGLTSDTADLLLGLRSKSLVGTKSALIAILAPAPFVGAGLVGLTRVRR